MQHNAHVELFYECMVEVYTDAGAIGISVAHIAEWMLERWYDVWSLGGYLAQGYPESVLMTVTRT